MPPILLTSSLILYFELSYSELLELNHKYPLFLSEKLVNPGYSTLHLIPSTVENPLDELLSWPRPDRDHYFTAMTQRKQAAPVTIIPETDQIDNNKSDIGTITVKKFGSVDEFIQTLSTYPFEQAGCVTVLFTVKHVPESTEIISETRELFQKQLGLGLRPSALPSQTDYSTIDWTRFAVSCSWGSAGEFRADSRRGGIFDLSNWSRFAGGWTQLHHLKAELSNVIGITGKYGD